MQSLKKQTMVLWREKITERREEEVREVTACHQVIMPTVDL